MVSLTGVWSDCQQAVAWVLKPFSSPVVGFDGHAMCRSSVVVLTLVV
jgi:hypothetical protein